MSKAVLISIRPEWVKKILAGEKTLEVRKNRPNMETPFKVYIYCTAGNLSYKVNGGMVCNVSGGKMVVGEFVCDNVIVDTKGENCDILCAQGCMSLGQVNSYGGNRKLYGWHISNLKIYDFPKPLENFKPWHRECKCNDLGLAIPECEMCHDCAVEKPPQSWCYVEELK